MGPESSFVGNCNAAEICSTRTPSLEDTNFAIALLTASSCSGERRTRASDFEVFCALNAVTATIRCLETGLVPNAAEIC